MVPTIRQHLLWHFHDNIWRTHVLCSHNLGNATSFLCFNNNIHFLLIIHYYLFAKYLKCRFRLTLQFKLQENVILCHKICVNILNCSILTILRAKFIFKERNDGNFLYHIYSNIAG